MPSSAAQQDQDPSKHAAKRRHLFGLCLASLGVVYGDIGTSPLYALRLCFYGEHSVPVTEANVLGVLSLICWSLIVVISIKYLNYVMRADNRGEGGVLALMALALASASKKGRLLKSMVLLLGLFGAALLYGDGMITPAISVLAAVEGLEIAAPGLEHFVIPITVAILVGLFAFQKRGTAGVGAVFGPITLVWLVSLLALGVGQVVQNLTVLRALSPIYGISFLMNNQLHGFFILGAVFLVVTGGEALYADLGHFGLRPIRLAWFALVLPALMLNYFGQGALLLAHPDAASNPFYQMAPSWALYPLLALATCATVIASQAVVSGAFSLTRQASMLGFLPRLRIRHTSASLIGQVYVPSINWILLLGAVGLVLGFTTSSALAAAYGIAVSGTMAITTLLACLVARWQWRWSLLAAVVLTTVFLVVDVAFLGANMIKVQQGGWFPLLVAGTMILLMTTWKKGRVLLAKRVQDGLVPLDDFFELMRIEPNTRVPGVAVFMTGSSDGTPPALMNVFLHTHAIHKQVILLTIVTEDRARVDSSERFTIEQLPNGVARMIARYGFMEDPDVVRLLNRDDSPVASIDNTTFFLGRETLLAGGRNGISRWRERLFRFMSRNARPASAFFNLPPDRVMEVGAHIEL